MLRRAQGSALREGDAPTPARIRFAGWCLDTRNQQLLSPEGVVIALGQSDYQTLLLLVSHPHRPLSRDLLIEAVFKRQRMPFDRAIDVCVSRLRHYLEDDGRSPRLIRTVRNAGYQLCVDAHADAP